MLLASLFCCSEREVEPGFPVVVDGTTNSRSFQCFWSLHTSGHERVHLDDLSETPLRMRLKPALVFEIPPEPVYPYPTGLMNNASGWNFC